MMLTPPQATMADSKGSALQELDAKLFVAYNETISILPGNLDAVLNKMVPLCECEGLRYITNVNLLRSLVFSVSPVASSVEIIGQYANKLLTCRRSSSFSNDLDESELIEDIETLLVWFNDEFGIEIQSSALSIIEIADDITSRVIARSEAAGLFDQKSASVDELGSSFAIAKVKELSKYYSDIGQFDSLFQQMSQYSHFKTWLDGVITPYSSYYNNYASLISNNEPAYSFLSNEDFWDQFDKLIQPVSIDNTNKNPRLTLEFYLRTVILPFSAYNGQNLGPLLDWLFKRSPKELKATVFERYGLCIRSVLSFVDTSPESFPNETITDLIKHYIAACYYFAFYEQEDATSIDISKVYDTVKETVTSLVSRYPSSGGSANIVDQILLDPPDVSSLAEFASLRLNPLAPLFSSDVSVSLALLEECVGVSALLYPVCEMSMTKFLDLKKSNGTDLTAARKIVSRIMAHTEKHNIEKVLNSVQIFTTSFFDGTAVANAEIGRTVIERLLAENFLDQALVFFKSLRVIAPDEAFAIIEKKFWSSFEASTNFDDKSGHLKTASDCFNLMNGLSSEGGLDEDNKNELLRLRHLLKGIKNLNNLKLRLPRSEATTPRILVEKLSRSESDNMFTPLSLMSLVLEQNPKSYLAYEKLYKITSDFAIFLNIDLDTIPFAKVQAVCIEYALIDNNFDVAYKRSMELFQEFDARGKNEELNDYWLTFYQVGKFTLPDWFNDEETALNNKKIEILLKQREVLAYTFKLTKPSSASVNNSRLILNQIMHTQALIDAWYEQAELLSSKPLPPIQTEQQMLSDATENIIKEGTHTSAQASEKLSNLFVSGLGWAIGANR